MNSEKWVSRLGGVVLTAAFALLLAFVVWVVAVAAAPSLGRSGRLMSSCELGEHPVMVFPEGHAWRQTWLTMTNVGQENATAYYGSQQFWGFSYMTSLAPQQRMAIRVSDLVWDKRASFTSRVWSDTDTVVAAVVSWNNEYTHPIASPIVLTCATQ